ncbi:hypothetical protein [Desertivirga brevis]|uniref:hypothetical protein n=1 Tax=Desertivirga brevis TaxID=2810310 RepID=UPI001A95AB83|nr:hypothetical protein [Pedobacter sp. SYSU D00873]
MITKISRTEAIRAKIKQEGKVTPLDKASHISAITTMNQQLEAVRREYQVKDRNSQITAATVILTA